MANTILILIADDHAMVRTALCERINREPDMEVVADVNSAEEAVTQAMQVHPDVVVLDVDMPGLVSFEAARRIRSRYPDTRVLFLSAFTHDRYIDQALAAEASGYVAKAEPLAVIIEAIRKVASGLTYYSPEVLSRIVFDASGSKLAKKGESRCATLSPREQEVLKYIAQGLSKKEIAATMGLSVKTVDGHCTKVMKKLGIHDRVVLARFAIREGFAEP